jgi:hypothetical protein
MTSSVSELAESKTFRLSDRLVVEFIASARSAALSEVLIHIDAVVL